MAQETSPPSSEHPEFADADITAALRRSGYLLEQRIEGVLVQQGYTVHASRRVVDAHEGKIREMDLLAERLEVRSPEQWKERPSVAVRLLVECVNNRFPLAFFEKPVSYAEAHEACTLSGEPLHVGDPSNDNGFYLLADQAGVSWWRTTPVWSTQYCGFEPRHGKPPRLEATQFPDHHGTFEKLVAEAEAEVGEISKPERAGAVFAGGCLMLVRPVVVLQGRLLGVVTGGTALTVADRPHVHYLRRGVVKGKRVAWVVDVVTEASFLAYLKSVDTTLNQVRLYCTDHREVVQRALTSESARALALTARRSSR